MKNKITDLRNHLFATIEGLLDEENPMDLDRAQAVAKVAEVIVESAKAEVQFLKTINADPSTSFWDEKEAPRLLTT